MSKVVVVPSLLLLIGLTAAFQGASPLRPDPPMVCPACDEWNRPQEPFRIFGNTWYVGTAGLSAVLITSDEGHVLLDGGLSQSAPLVDGSIRALGFRTGDIRIIAASHEHYDHVGGIAALQRTSGATVVHSDAGAPALACGMPNPDDPQYAFGREANAYPAVANVRAVADGEVVRVGPIAVTAHYTPGHTPGSTTWSWRACDDDRCLDVVYADSLNPVSADSFRFTADPARLSAYRRSIATVAALPCDIVIAVHPGFTDLAGKLQRRQAGATPDPFIDAGGCRAYAADAAARLDARVAAESR